MMVLFFNNVVALWKYYAATIMLVLCKYNVLCSYKNRIMKVSCRYHANVMQRLGRYYVGTIVAITVRISCAGIMHKLCWHHVDTTVVLVLWKYRAGIQRILCWYDVVIIVGIMMSVVQFLRWHYAGNPLIPCWYHADTFFTLELCWYMRTFWW